MSSDSLHVSREIVFPIMNEIFQDKKMTFITNFTKLDIETWNIPLDIISLDIATIFSLIFIIIIMIDKTCHTISMMLTATLCFGIFVFACGMLGIASVALENDLKQMQYQHSLCIVHPRILLMLEVPQCIIHFSYKHFIDI
jgi:hypothetical protein